jgi:hypothetical protein
MASLILSLRVLRIGPGDEVLVPAGLAYCHLAPNLAELAGANPVSQAEELRPVHGRSDRDAGRRPGAPYGPLVVFAAETGLRTNDWVAVGSFDLDRYAAAVPFAPCAAHRPRQLPHATSTRPVRPRDRAARAALPQAHGRGRHRGARSYGTVAGVVSERRAGGRGVRWRTRRACLWSCREGSSPPPGPGLRGPAAGAR